MLEFNKGLNKETFFNPFMADKWTHKNKAPNRVNDMQTLIQIVKEFLLNLLSYILSCLSLEWIVLQKLFETWPKSAKIR